MKFIFVTFPMAEYQHRVLTAAGIQDRLMSFAYLKDVPDNGYLEPLIDNGYVDLDKWKTEKIREAGSSLKPRKHGRKLRRDKVRQEKT